MCLLTYYLKITSLQMTAPLESVGVARPPAALRSRQWGDMGEPYELPDKYLYREFITDTNSCYQA